MTVRMTVRVATIALASIAGGIAVMAAPPPNAIIIAQPNSPVEIIGYTARYQRRGTYTTEGIAHSLEYKSRGTQKVVAVRFALVSFDVFNRFLGKTGGISMDDVNPSKTQKGEWVSSPHADFSFLTGLAYVDLVRLDDGTIWQADESTVLDEVRKIEKDFDAKLLKEKEGAAR
jgi:hypothetical protein